MRKVSGYIKGMVGATDTPLGKIFDYASEYIPWLRMEEQKTNEAENKDDDNEEDDAEARADKIADVIQVFSIVLHHMGMHSLIIPQTAAMVADTLIDNNVPEHIIATLCLLAIALPFVLFYMLNYTGRIMILSALIYISYGPYKMVWIALAVLTTASKYYRSGRDNDEGCTYYNMVNDNKNNVILGYSGIILIIMICGAVGMFGIKAILTIFTAIVLISMAMLVPVAITTKSADKTWIITVMGFFVLLLMASALTMSYDTATMKMILTGDAWRYANMKRSEYDLVARSRELAALAREAVLADVGSIPDDIFLSRDMLAAYVKSNPPIPTLRREIHSVSWWRYLVTWMPSYDWMFRML